MMRKSICIAIFFVLAFAFSCHAQQSPGPSGTYIFSEDSKSYITFYPNGTFFMKQRKSVPDLENPFQEMSGNFVLKGDEITLTTSEGGEGTIKYKGNKIEDSDAKLWVKQGTAPPTVTPEDVRRNKSRRF